MGIIVSKLSFEEVNRPFCGIKLRFRAPLARRRQTKFLIIKLTITSSNDNFENRYPLVRTITTAVTKDWFQNYAFYNSRDKGTLKKIIFLSI